MVYLYNEVNDYWRIDSSVGPTGNQLFLGLVDDNANGGLDVSVPFAQWKGLDAKFKAGAWVEGKQRSFVARRSQAA